MKLSARRFYSGSSSEPNWDRVGFSWLGSRFYNQQPVNYWPTDWLLIKLRQSCMEPNNSRWTSSLGHLFFGQLVNPENLQAPSSKLVASCVRSSRARCMQKTFGMATPRIETNRSNQLSLASLAELKPKYSLWTNQMLKQQQQRKTTTTAMR